MGYIQLERVNRSPKLSSGPWGFRVGSKRITVGGEGPWEGPESRPQACSVSLEALP